MYTEQIKRNRGNAFVQMHTLGNSSNLEISKLGSSLIASMESLQSKKQQILKTFNVARLPVLVIQFKKQHTNFLELQKSFFELDQKTPQTQKLRIRIKDFLQKIRVEDVQRKLQDLKQQKIKQAERLEIMNKVESKGMQPGSQMLMDNQSLIRQRLLQQQSEELKIIQKLINDIKSIAIKTSSLIYQQGVNLNLAAQTVKSARQKFKQGKDQLIQANQYQQDTNKKKLFLCLLIVIIVVVILMIILASSAKK